MVEEPDVIGRIVEQNIGAYRAMPSRLQEDVSQESQVASDYRGRLVYELLQNADDAMADASTTSDRVSFLVTDDELWIANTGRALTDGDVLGLCGLGASSKVDAAGNRRASIGHKGLGFKSVLEVTDEPSVFSRTTSFTLGARNARPLVRSLWNELSVPEPRAVPAMRFPAHVSATSLRWSDYQAEGFNTAFRFPFKDSIDGEHRAAVADLLLGLPLTTVLFLKHLEEIVVRIEQNGRHDQRAWTVRRERLDETTASWSETHGFGGLGTYRVVVADGEQTMTFLVAHDDGLPIGNHRAGLSGPAWEGVDLTEVSVAALEPGTATIPDEWRHFHVFLPTAEVCPYPILVNGAFATDLSRQHVRVSEDADDYNAHLVRHAARLVAADLIPLLRPAGTDSVLRMLDRGDVVGDHQGAAHLLHRAITEELMHVPLIPTEDGAEAVLAQTVLPTALLEDDGQDFRPVLRGDATWNEQRFPVPWLCAGRWTRIAADHGANELSPADTLSALARCHDPERSASVDDESGGFELDPLLELSMTLWTRATVEDREELELRAREEPLFPVYRHDDRTMDRVVLGDTPAFFPPQSARTAIALPDLRFMCHALCWGALNKKERAELLDNRMNAWASMFGVREFRFETVVQAAVLPALVLKPDDEALERLESLRSHEALATICQLAGRFAKPDRPLRYQRLQSDRALVNLSRLPVPCRATEGEQRWLPAYRVYFGEDWIQDDSVEHLHRALPEDTAATFEYLAPPEAFLGLLGDYAQPATATSTEDLDDEVDVDEDADQAIESNERDRWIAFLSWIGVNRPLRPVHFHDVEDDATGWLTTKDLAQPNGWAFRSLGATWDSFEDLLRSRLAAQHDHTVTPYLYEIHDLDQIVPIIDAANSDATSTVARAFLEHLARHWSWLASFADCQVALVERGKSPGQRTKPQRALPEELASGGDNLWIQRLRSRSICPTRLGPRPPTLTWRQTAELERRFSRRGRSSATLLPILDVPEDISSAAVRSLSERLGIRGEPSPSNFTSEDAHRLCTQLEQLFPDGIDASDLREVIKPVYRQVFELLSGHAASADSDHPLRDTPLLANTSHGLRFRPATQMLYAATPGIRERSGVAGAVPTFVLEAEAPAAAPLRSLFGMRTLEDALEWHPQPGECALDPDELAAMRAGLNELLPSLLARIRTERSSNSDLRVLRELVDRVEPVESLMLSCALDGETVAGLAARPYFVQVGKGADSLQAFLVWGAADGWPPTPEAAQGLAMALADALRINLVETFVAFIQSDADQRRRLLDIAGGAGLLAEIADELTDVSPEPAVEDAPDPQPTAGADEAEVEKPAVASQDPGPAAPPIPLLRFEDLTVDGVPVPVVGDHTRDNKDSSNGERRTAPAGPRPSVSGGRAAPGTDLTALDALGMRIAMSYELLRLRREGHVEATDQLEGEAAALVIDVHSPAVIRAAVAASVVVKRVMEDLAAVGVSQLYPGFDILTIANGKPDRLIELKSSGVDARVQVMSWNEWKTARASNLRASFWLYLVGNLRSDLPHADPYIRAIHDPFGSLVADEVSEQQLRRAVQLRVREFKRAEHLDLGVISGPPARQE